MYIQNLRRYQTLRVLADPAAIAGAWFLTIAVRLLLNPVAAKHATLQMGAYWAPSLPAVLLLWLLLAWRLGHYRAPARRSWQRSLLSVLEQTLLASLVVAAITLFGRSAGVDVSRAFLVLFVPVSFATLALARAAVFLFCCRADAAAPPPVRAALLGARPAAAQFLRQIALAPGRAAFKGVILPEDRPDPGAGAPAHWAARRRGGGATPPLAALINRERLTEIVVLSSSVERAELERCNTVCKRMGLPMHYAYELDLGPSRAALRSFHGVPILQITPVAFSKSEELAKRVFDLLLSSAALLAAAPLMLAICAAIKLDSPGPVFYRAPRVGKGGRHFTCFKFRSMHLATSREGIAAANERSGHIFKIRRDPRVTPVGRWLRRYSLDELPQFFNVVRGEMSIVGPRPLPASDLDGDGMSRHFAEWAEGRSRVQPGITGLWQIRGRSELPFEEMVRLDLEYTQSWSLMLDLTILLETPALVLKGTGAY